MGTVTDSSCPLQGRVARLRPSWTGSSTGTRPRPSSNPGNGSCSRETRRSWPRSRGATGSAAPIPYFMGRDGGLRSTEHAYAAELPGGAGAGVYRYGPKGLPHIARHHPGHGFTVLLLPGLSPVHRTFAENVARYPGVFDRPLVGWISGVALEDVGKVAPKVFDGTTGESTADQGVAMHVVLPPGQRASVDVVNLFAPGDGDAIVFPESGFSATTALVNGKAVNLAAYLADRKVDTALPLVTDRDGAMVNVSFRSVDPAAGLVEFPRPGPRRRGIPPCGAGAGLRAALCRPIPARRAADHLRLPLHPQLPLRAPGGPEARPAPRADGVRPGRVPAAQSDRGMPLDRAGRPEPLIEQRKAPVDVE